MHPYLNLSLIAFGSFILTIIALVIIFDNIDLTKKKDEYQIITFFKFGLIIVPHTNRKLQKNIELIRKDTAAGMEIGEAFWYFNAPTWFNTYIWNLGGVKK